MFKRQTNSFETLVIILLNLGPLYIDLFLRSGGAMILLEERLHIYRRDLEFVLRSSGQGKQQDDKYGRDKVTEIHVSGVSELVNSG